MKGLVRERVRHQPTALVAERNVSNRENQPTSRIATMCRPLVVSCHNPFSVNETGHKLVMPELMLPCKFRAYKKGTKEWQACKQGTAQLENTQNPQTGCKGTLRPAVVDWTNVAAC